MKKRTAEQESLDRLADALIDDILDASDEDILEEFQDSYGDPDVYAEKMRALFGKIIIKSNKHRLEVAKAGAEAARNVSSEVIVPMSIAEGRRILRNVLNNPNSSRKLTLAARKQKENELSDADVLSLLGDLNELGMLSDDNSEENP